jgi:hypothetical protein
VIFALLPVLGALLVHAVGHGRWLLAAPVAVALCVAAARKVSVKQTNLRLLIAAAICAALALLFPAPPAGPIPPAVLSPLTGALVGMTALCALARNLTYAWIYAGLLALLSIPVETRGVASAGFGLQLTLALGALAACTLVAVAALGRVAAAPFIIYAALVAAGTYGLTQLGLGSEQWVTEAVYRLAQRSGLTAGLQGSISLRARSSVERSMSPLFEITAAGADEHLRAAVFDRFDGSAWTTSQELDRARLDPAKLSPATGAVELTPLEPLGETAPAPAGARASGFALAGGWLLRGTVAGTVELQTGDGLPL